MITFTQDDILRGKLVTPGWYELEIKDYEETLSADAKSTNYALPAKVVKNAEDGNEEFTGVPVTIRFNSKAMGMAIGYCKAVEPGFEPIPGARFELRNTIGKRVVAFVANKEYQGNISNEVKAQFKPIGA